MKRCIFCLVFIGLLFSLPLTADPILKGTPETVQQYKYALGLINRRLFDEALKVLARVIDDPSYFENRDAAYFWQGECYYRLGQYPQAIAVFERFCKEFPRSVFHDRGTYGLGWAYAKDDNPKSAVEAFARVSNKDPKLRIEALLKMGFLMTKTNMDPKETAKVYEELLGYPSLLPSQKFDAYMQIGVQRFEESLFFSAKEAFIESLKWAKPEKKARVLLYLAESYFREKKYQEAIPRYRQIEEASSTPDVYDKANYSLAWCLIKTGKPNEAISLFARIAENPVSSIRKEAVKNLVELLMNLHKYNEAVVWMKKGAHILLGDESLEMEYLRGLALSRLGEFGAAIGAFNSFIKSYPKHYRAEDAYYQIALMNITMGKFLNAIKELEPLLRRETTPKTREKAIYRIGECYLNLGNLSNAKNAFERVIQEYPEGQSRLNSLYQLGEIEYQAGNHEKALHAFSTIGKTNGELAGQAIFRGGEVLMKAGRFNDSIALFDDYLTRFPKGNLHEDALFKIGLCELERNDKGRALAAFSELRESKGYFRQEARFQIGEIALSMANFPLAIQHFKAILAEDPKNPLASRAGLEIGICLFKMKDFEPASEVFKKLIKTEKSSDAVIPECLLWLGRTMMALGRLEDGILEVLKVVVLYPKSPLLAEAYAEAARGYAKLKKSEKSSKMWKEVLKSKPSSALSEEAKGALKN